MIAKALGREAEMQAFTLGNLRWLCCRCHQRDALQGIIGKAVGGSGMNWREPKKALQMNRQWERAFLLPFSIGTNG